MASGGTMGTGGANASGGGSGTGGGGASGRGGSSGGASGTGGGGASVGRGGSSGGASGIGGGGASVGRGGSNASGGAGGAAATGGTSGGGVGLATVPVYTTALAQISVGGAPTDLANAEYDYGGGHHNDSLRFDDQGKSYKYYHSSFGFGFRSCQPMDCIDVYAPGGTTPGTDGCTSARALPEICVLIKADGTHDALVDRFMKCPGDSGGTGANLQ